MPQIINTNAPSLVAQGKLDKSGEGLAASFKRLSSGLRINSAKDDAAGLAIATRFTSTISGLTVAKRNANDAISLAQVAEGALEEVTSILQRSRELALQSANGSNSAADRKALQSEVNQLKQELTRIATTTTFNGNNVLNGNLQNTQFQIGAEANQTVSVSINDTRTTAIGTNALTTDNTDGIEQATHKKYIGGNFASGAIGVGADIGKATGAATNGYTASTVTISYVSSAGITVTDDVAISANDAADTIATNLSAADGVSATAFNQVTLSGFSEGVDTDSTASTALTLTVGGATMEIVDSDNGSDYAEIATAINADADFKAAGVYAIGTTDEITIYSMVGDDIIIDNATGSEFVVTVTSAFNGGGSAVVSSNATENRGGRVDITLDQGYSIAQTDATVLGTLTTAAVGVADLTGGNAVEQQDIVISGSTGSATVTISANDTADNIVTKINAVSGSTNVKAKAVTTLTLQGLSDDGTVSFELFGDNSVGASVSTAVTTTDLSALARAINDISGNTGITAAVGDSNASIVLTHSTGKDIGIKGFNHNAAIAYKDPTTVAVEDDGSTVVAPNIVTIDVIGNADSNDGTTVTLKKGGTADTNTGQDSTVVGGEVTFTSSAVFSMASSIDGASSPGSLFGVAANGGSTSSSSTVNAIDISTIAGANAGITVLDDAMNQISEIRASLGAVQSRFESSIRNLSNNLENLNVARSRILDADFAAETAALSKFQILSQAGIAVLAQANALPQSVLALLK